MLLHRVLLTSMLTGATLLLSASFVLASPPREQLRMVVDESQTGSYLFAQELGRLLAHSKNTLLPALVTQNPPAARLDLLKSYQADLVVLDSESAYTLLPHYEEAVVLTLLWHNVLHVIAKSPREHHLTKNTTGATIYLHPNAARFQKAWDAVPAPLMNAIRPLQTVQSGAIQEMLTTLAGGETLIVQAPSPLEELKQAFQLESRYRLLELEPELQKVYLQTNPSMTVVSIPRGRYPNQFRELSLPASFMLLVARRDAPSDMVQNVLDAIFAQHDSVAPHPLFHELTPEINRGIREQYLFHPIAEEYWVP